MGTSVNQASPRTLNWSAVHAGYRHEDVPVSRVASEVWRAAINQPTGNLANLLAQPIVARLGELAVRATSSINLVRETTHAVTEMKAASLAADIARRAAIQCLSAQDRVNAYTERVFAEATSYLVSRDLAGFVGSGRAETVAQSLEFKAAIVEHVQGVARNVTRPQTLDPVSWAKHVNKIVSTLRKSGR